EYVTYRGMYHGRTLTVCSHGVGAPGAAIAFEELIEAGAKRIIRIGSCGSLQPQVQPGDLVIATAAVQRTGYGREVAPKGYPAVADLELTLALRETAVALEYAPHTGIVLTRDAFFTGVNPAAAPNHQQMAEANVLAVEMECAALFLVGSLRQIPTAAILAVDGVVTTEPDMMETFDPHQDVVRAGIEQAIQVALNCVVEIGD
ncbi:MAG TPA: purine-nucleoside phosphorylase, partial [Chloroflexi bacterium]|nr:purine-nucleoside phosphorylase [Chloroflexota bacterium]